MWNHAPPMWEKMSMERVAPPKFSQTEMANLFAFLYYFFYKFYIDFCFAAGCYSVKKHNFF